ncbi:odorant receptor 67c-like isoform X1 [Leptopilina boulardi]|uniref:odorant receptor 67c-like isoform X1 n=2 Tax=Leptopilina boulardi TaxID=63433 RepID=UPI0021F63C9A|nr:odorant receptor 67c-like isoform X1 [Leptopilina boulardi]
MQDSRNTKIAEYTFNIMSYIGLWRPMSLKSLWAIRIYNFCTIIVLLNQFYFSITFLINLYQNKNKSEIFTDSIFCFSNTFLVAFKIAYFNYRKKDVKFLMKLFLQKQNLPCNIEEAVIYKKFEDKERFIERIFVISSLFTATLYVFLPLLSKKTISLPLNRWNPYSINSKTIFWMTYMNDILTGYFFALTYASLESILTIFLQQIGTHLDIFIDRLLKLQNIKQNNVEKIDIYEQESNIIKDCINHHLRIFSMENTLNDIFSLLILCQFFVSILNICTLCFHLTKAKISSGYFWLLIMLMTCFTSQIFIYCFLGEELTRKSISISDEIYNMDWTSLTKQTKEKLMLIMMRSNRPIQFTGASIITLSLETFLKVVKASYSSFNLLRQTN